MRDVESHEGHLLSPKLPKRLKNYVRLRMDDDLVLQGSIIKSMIMCDAGREPIGAPDKGDTSVICQHRPNLSGRVRRLRGHAKSQPEQPDVSLLYLCRFHRTISRFLVMMANAIALTVRALSLQVM